MDAFNEAGDIDDDAWKCLAVIGHMWRRHDANDVHLKVHALWQDGEDTWVRADAMRLQDPISLAKYAVKAKLTSQKEWNVGTRLCCDVISLRDEYQGPYC